MEKLTELNRSEWMVMECVWENPHTLMELVALLGNSAGWSKSTVATMVRRMEEKGILCHEEQGRTKIFHPAISREAVTIRETKSLLQRAYHGSVGLLVSAMAKSGGLSKADIDELYEILREAEEDAK